LSSRLVHTVRDEFVFERHNINPGNLSPSGPKLMRGVGVGVQPQPPDVMARR
jgi:hypothetical protein